MRIQPKGRVLQVGEIIQATDYYLSSSGRWETPFCYGCKVVNNGVVYIRPESKPFEGWIATPDPNSADYIDEEVEKPHVFWAVAPKDYWEQHRSIPDDCIRSIVPGFSESMAHTLECNDPELPQEAQEQMLVSLGFEIIPTSEAKWWNQ